MSTASRNPPIRIRRATAPAIKPGMVPDSGPPKRGQAATA